MSDKTAITIVEIVRRVIPSRGVVGDEEEDRRVLNETKHVFGRADESISDGHGENVKAEHDNVSEASGISRDRWMTQSMIFDRGRKQACHKLTMKMDGNEVPRSSIVESDAYLKLYVCTDRGSDGLLGSDCKEQMKQVPSVKSDTSDLEIL